MREFKERFRIAAVTQKSKREAAFRVIGFPVKLKADDIGIKCDRLLKVADPYHSVKIFHVSDPVVCSILLINYYTV